MSHSRLQATNILLQTALPTLLLAMLVLGDNYAFGQYQIAQSTIPNNWLQQAIAAQDRTIDFGTVARAATTEHRFHIRNPLQQDLHLQSVRASCGCTTPTIETKVIKPGEVGTIHARFNTDRFTGQKQAKLVVSITSPFFTELHLNVRGYIRSDIVLTPGEIEFGQIPEGSPKQIEMRLDYAGRSDWKIKEVTSDLPFVKVEAEEVSRTPGRIQYKLVAKLAENAPAGMHHNQVILHTDDRRLTSVPVVLSANVQSSVQMSPKTFALGKMNLGDQKSQRLVVRGRKPFKILDIKSQTAELQFDQVSDEARAAHMINITISPKANSDPGVIRGEVLVLTDLKEKPLKLGLTYEIPTEQTSPTP